MSNVRISEKGKALLKNRLFSGLISRAIVKNGDHLAAGGSVTVKAKGHSVTFRSAMPFANAAAMNHTAHRPR